MSSSVMSSVSSYVVVTGVPSCPLTSVFGITAQEFRYLKVQIISISKQWGYFDWKLLVGLSVQLVIGDNEGHAQCSVLAPNTKLIENFP